MAKDQSHTIGAAKRPPKRKTFLPTWDIHRTEETDLSDGVMIQLKKNDPLEPVEKLLPPTPTTRIV